MSHIRVRISPSPSGQSIHIGNLKTALFNYLFAAKNGGVFYYRVENTDQAREVNGAAEVILNDLKWAGIAPTEGHLIGGQYAPYLQSDRIDIYRRYLARFLERGLAYVCRCREDELNRQREEASKTNPKNPWKYPGTCRDANYPLDANGVVRFRSPNDGAIEFDDIVFGKRIIPNKENFDFVIMRGDGSFLYNFACVVDDIEHRTSHIIRGMDHLKNVPYQILMYQAIGADVPRMAHLPMLLNLKGEKLSKRDGSTLVSEYRENGFAPRALLNILARFGWSCGDQELFSLEEMTDKFRLEDCGRNNGKFDPVKFSAINHAHLKSDTLLPDHIYAHHTLPFLEQRGIKTDVSTTRTLVPIIRHKCKTFIEAANELDPMLRDNIALDENAKKLITPEAKTKLSDYSKFLSELNDWTEIGIRTHTQIWLDMSNLTIKDIGQPVRASVFGRTQSPDLFKVMSALGKDMTLGRLQNVL